MNTQELMKELLYINLNDEVLIVDKQGIEYCISEVSAENGKLYLQIDD